MMVKEGVYPILAPKYWTGPWEVNGVVIPGFGFNVAFDGQRVRHRRASAETMEVLHMRPIDLRRDFENCPTRLGRRLAVTRTVNRGVARLEC